MENKRDLSSAATNCVQQKVVISYTDPNDTFTGTGSPTTTKSYAPRLAPSHAPLFNDTIKRTDELMGTPRGTLLK